jgi:hypothetical protein
MDKPVYRSVIEVPRLPVGVQIPRIPREFTGPPPVAEMGVTLIDPVNGNHVYANGGTNAGNGAYGSDLTPEFSINNDAGATGDLTVDPVQVNGFTGVATSVGFISQPPSPIIPGGAGNFQLDVSATVAGPWTADLEIDNNDPDDDPFLLTIAGFHIPAPVPDPVAPWLLLSKTDDLEQKPLQISDGISSTLDGVTVGTIPFGTLPFESKTLQVFGGGLTIAIPAVSTVGALPFGTTGLEAKELQTTNG